PICNPAYALPPAPCSVLPLDRLAPLHFSFTGRRRRVNRAQPNAVDAAGVGLDDFELNAGELDLLADRRHAVEVADQQPCDRRKVVGLDLFMKYLFDLLDLGA